ncbi:NAD-dependent epimerase/dehydratase family protein [Streptomyces coffeae]|uniref:NAD-dependent epimerase/dehydratase family protein n=1 Tax=Streptomyces coffeae TaxID=621382 RepID=A0ABS1NF60_9ACTN|nr:NAD-dependent epimerase/dehydratase family protein [Streptomyces coffeae]MBL1098515.1 NAD-dependent epimerase/dehydratase family protein [Streptomyces coffeae]
MRLLILGGTAFLGRAFATEALAAGHTVTAFNRGRTGPDIPGVESVRGDRTVAADLSAPAAGGSWDTVVDTCGYVPRVVGSSAAALSGLADTYVFVSSVAAYRRNGPFDPLDGDESAPLHDCPDEAGPDGGHYGVLKAGCERAVRRHFAGRTQLLRPGAVVGPHEDTGMSAHWLRRFADGGPVLAPGSPRAPLPLVDARDVARFGLALANGAAEGGAWNVAGPRGLDYGAWLTACRDATGGGEPVWVPDDFLLAQGLRPWLDLPLWAPGAVPERSVWGFSTERARGAGLVCRPAHETAADTWRWLRPLTDLPQRPDQPAPALDRARELAVLDAWATSRPEGSGSPEPSPEARPEGSRTR